MDTPLNDSVSNLKCVAISDSSYTTHSKYLENYNTQRGYEFHWLTDPDTPELFGSNVPATRVLAKFNALNFVSRAVKYVKGHKIESVIFFMSSLLF